MYKYKNTYSYNTIGSSESDWTPSEISTYMWLDASDTSTITESSGNISQWDDKSGNSRHSTQSIGSNQPSTGDSTQNSKNVISFDGTEWFNMDSDLHNITNGSNSHFIVSRQDISGSSKRIVNYDNAGTKGGMRYLSGGSSIQFSSGSFNGPTSTGNTNSNFNVLFGSRDSSLLSISVNGETPITTNDGSSIVAINANIGTFSDGVAGTLIGDIAEIIILNSSAPLSLRQTIEGYLSHKWGITSSLPSDHPYKINPPKV